MGGKKLVWSDEFRFILIYIDSMVRVCRKQQVMNLVCHITWVGGRGIVIWEAFSWYTLGSLLSLLETFIYRFTYLDITADHMYLFIVTFLHGHGYFKRDNTPVTGFSFPFTHAHPNGFRVTGLKSSQIFRTWFQI